MTQEKPGKKNIKAADRVGQRYGRWVIVSVGQTCPKQQRKFWCRCDCGREKTVGYSNLFSGKSRGCGFCGSRGHKPKSFGIPIREWGTDMRKAYTYWVTKHHEFAEPWKSDFQSFYEEAWAARDNRSLRALDVNRPIGPGNWFWGPVAKKLVKLHGITMSQNEAAEMMGVSREAVRQRAEKAEGNGNRDERIGNSGNHPAIHHSPIPAPTEPEDGDQHATYEFGK